MACRRVRWSSCSSGRRDGAPRTERRSSSACRRRTRSDCSTCGPRGGQVVVEFVTVPGDVYHVEQTFYEQGNRQREPVCHMLCGTCIRDTSIRTYVSTCTYSMYKYARTHTPARRQTGTHARTHTHTRTHARTHCAPV